MVLPGVCLGQSGPVLSNTDGWLDSLMETERTGKSLLNTFPFNADEAHDHSQGHHDEHSHGHEDHHHQDEEGRLVGFDLAVELPKAWSLGAPAQK